MLLGQAQVLNTELTGYQKLSPGARLFLNHSHDHALFPRIEGDFVAALIQVTDAGKSLPKDVILVSSFGTIKSVWLNENGLLDLVNDENIEYIDISWRLNAPRTLNDTARVLSKVNEVQNGLQNGLPMNYLGTDVVVGIVDIGFQSDNPNFYNGDGSVYRVKRWWHQNENSGQKPQGYNYGTELSAQLDILNARVDDGTHATHVAGIAAGSGYTTPALKYRGMAPDADLVFVTIRYSNDTLQGSALGDYVVANPTILDGFKYVYDYAQSVSKPAVCNLSWGMHTGPHDGTSLFDKAVEAMTGSGKILVGSAGNEAGNQIHIGHQFQNDTAYSFAIDRNRNDFKHESVYMDLWGSQGESLQANIALLDTLGNKVLETPFFSSAGSALYKKLYVNGADSLWLTLSPNASFINNGKPEILMMVESSNASKLRIRLGVTGKGGFHAWNSGQPYRWTSGGFLDKVKGNDFTGKYINGNADFTVGENGGTGKSTITVGSYVARNHWTDFNGIYHEQNWIQSGEISGFSSHGPSVDLRFKPDISAPGQNIASSVNYRTFAGWMAENSPYKSSFNGVDQYWTLLSGTSMAGPHVTGIVALLLQMKADIGPGEMKKIIQKSAYRDNYTGADSNNISGFGKVDAFAAMKQLIALHQQVLEGSEFRVFPNPCSSGKLGIIQPGMSKKAATLTLNTVTGALYMTKEFHFDELGYAEIEVPLYTDGMFGYEIKTDLGNSTGFVLFMP